MTQLEVDAKLSKFVREQTPKVTHTNKFSILSYFRSEYRPQISDCFFATISFDWKSELNQVGFLVPPDVSNSNANIFLEINSKTNQ